MDELNIETAKLKLNNMYELKQWRITITDYDSITMCYSYEVITTKYFKFAIDLN